MQKLASLDTSESIVRARDNLDELFTAGRLCLVLGVLILVTYPEIALGSHAFSYRDAGLYGYPIAYYFRDCFWRGELPLWNPYSDCGIPFLAQWNTLVLYPPSVFYLLLPFPWSLNYFTVIHIFLAGIGMYFLAYRWYNNRFAACIAGLAFAWNGLSLHSLMWPNIVAALAWMPIILLLTDRAWIQGKRAIIFASLAGAMQMMTGSPEIILFTWIIVVAVLTYKSFHEKAGFALLFRRFLAIVLLVVGISSAQLLPFLDLLSHGHRNNSFGEDVWAMPPWGLANFLVPLFRCTPSVTGVFSQDEQQWTSSYYPGIAIFSLALFAAIKIRSPRTLLLSIGATLGILFSLGEAGFVLPTLKRILPILGFIRFPIKFVVITLFCFPLLAAAAIAWIEGSEFERRRRALLTTVMLSSTGILLVLTIAFYFPFPVDLWDVTWKNGLSRIFFLACLLGGLIYLRRVEKPVMQLTLSFGFLLLFGLEISTHMPRQNPVVITRGYETLPLQMTTFPRFGNSRAMVSREIQSQMDRSAHPNPLNQYIGQRSVLLGNCNLLNQIPKVNGFFPVYLREEYEVESLLYKKGPLPNLERFLGVSQVTSSTQMFAWDARTNFMPLATIGPEPVFADAATTLKLLASSEFDPQKTVYLPPEAKPLISVRQRSDAQILSSEFSAHQLTFEIEAKEAALLVLAQTYHHFWKPSVNGKIVPLLRANHGFQAVEVPPGKHRVRLVYEDLNFRIGALISACTLAACGIYLFLCRSR